MFMFIFPGVNDFIIVGRRLTELVAAEFYDDPETS
jgi:hypothetical protein